MGCNAILYARLGMGESKERMTFVSIGGGRIDGGWRPASPNPQGGRGEIERGDDKKAG